MSLEWYLFRKLSGLAVNWFSYLTVYFNIFFSDLNYSLIKKLPRNLILKFLIWNSDAKHLIWEFYYICLPFRFRPFICQVSDLLCSIVIAEVTSLPAMRASFKGLVISLVLAPTQFKTNELTIFLDREAAFP